MSASALRHLAHVPGEEDVRAEEEYLVELRENDRGQAELVAVHGVGARDEGRQVAALHSQRVHRRALLRAELVQVPHLHLCTEGTEALILLQGVSLNQYVSMVFKALERFCSVSRCFLRFGWCW